MVGITDKRQITAVFVGSLSGDFLPVQLVYQGKTTKCLPSINFPEKWHVTATSNHWCNESTTIDYIEKNYYFYLQGKRRELGLPTTHPALAMYLKGQTTEVLELLEQNNIFYAIALPTVLQESDVSKEFL